MWIFRLRDPRLPQASKAHRNCGLCAKNQDAAFLADNLLAGGQLIILCGTSPEQYFTLPGMRSNQIKFRKPEPDEQHVLEHLTVRLVRPEEIPRFDELLVKEHYLHSAQLVGEHLRYVAAGQSQWLALASWSARPCISKPGTSSSAGARNNGASAWP